MKARVIAYYLPQFHPVPENDKYWGKGFTEWTNVASAKPLFHGHYQPRIPSDLGFYDLRIPQVREEQAQLASEAGIEGFCYWHYWFGNGKMLLEKPFEEVLTTGKPDFPFCLCWANHTWSTKGWRKDADVEIIAEQTYPGDEDYIEHFNYCLPAFKDKRYITVDGKPLFCIFDPYRFADVKHFIDVWKSLALQNGLKGIYFVALSNSTSTIRRDLSGNLTRVLPDLKSSAGVYNDLLALGFDGINSWGKSRAEILSQGSILHVLNIYLHRHLKFLPCYKYNYPKVLKKQYYYAPEDAWENIYPTIIPGWDRSPRVGVADGIYVNATPDNFQRHIEDAVEIVNKRPDEHKIIFLRAWNEWGEGNYVEPDRKYGHGFLEAIRKAIMD